MNTELPKKLKKDSILETVFEIRFDSDDFPEVILGKLLAVPAWSGYARTRTAIADIPAPIRMYDDNLRHQALMQLTSEDGSIAVKLGSNVITYNNIHAYKGWDAYFEGLKESTKALLDTIDNIRIKRIGLRYINSLNERDHLIKTIDDLNIDVAIAKHPLSEKYNLNYIRNYSENCEATVRISTPELVQGIPENSSALIDIDVYSKDIDFGQDHNTIISWIDKAHSFEKKEFFGLIPQQILEKIKEE